LPSIQSKAATNGDKQGTSMTLKEYHRKRNFSATPEPKAGGERGQRIFVVQLHHASHRHYDFRLELEGTLKSWAVPKGPSFDPAVKRLAMEVEDHPISYATFEGDIPKGNYGAGYVDVFDHGTWEPEGNAHEGLRRGELKFTLHGDVLRGSWVLVRTRPQGSRHQWLLIKHRDEYAGHREADDFVDPSTDRPISKAKRRKTWSKSSETNVSPLTIEKAPKKGPAKKATKRSASKDAGLFLTHPEREVFPGSGITKLDVAEYYIAVAPWMLEELRHRPVSTVRCPNGAGAKCFFQKHLSPGIGAHVSSVKIREKSGTQPYLCIDDAPGLIELVQMNVIEFHPWGSKSDDVEHADRIVFDLDPHPKVAWKRVIAAARDTKKQLERIGLKSFLRTSGGKGLHVVVPLNPPAPWKDVKAFTQAFAQAMAKLRPNEYVAVAGEKNREGLIFIDWLRNGRGATSIASYSLRARAAAGVAMPIAWTELGRLRGGDVYTIKNAIKRTQARKRDPWESIANVRQKLPR
jgi:bifunctional non-homologous end joining protein LigD